MKKFYNTPAVLIQEYEISENITLSSDYVAGGELNDRDDDTVDMTGN